MLPVLILYLFCTSWSVYGRLMVHVLLLCFLEVLDGSRAAWPARRCLMVYGHPL